MTKPDSSPGERATHARYSLMELAETLEDVISLGRGDPDIDTPAGIRDAAIESLSRRELEVPPVRGLLSLRVALAERYRREKGFDLDPEGEILVTNGAQEGLFLSMLALVDPGDPVLVPDPRYSSYDQAVEAAGGTIAEVEMGEGRDFSLHADSIEAAARAHPRARLLVLVNPSNPTAALTKKGEVREIARVARERDLVVISDEIYEGLVFDGEELLSVASCEGMPERTVTLSGFSKTYAMTGFRVGYLLGPPSFIEAAARLKRTISGSSPLFSQLAAEAALAEPREVARERRALFDRRRRLMMSGLDSLGIPYGHPGGAFYVWADVSAYGLPASEFCRQLLLDARVLLFPGSSFGARWSSYVRISLLQPEGRIEEALSRMRVFAAKHS